jgi:phosphoribosylglycinamide formyltransferase 1
MKQVLILFGGQGTNACAIVKAIQSSELPMHCVCAISHRAHAAGIKHLQALNIPVEVIDHQSFSSKEAFEADLMKAIDKSKPDLIILAGFMRILSTNFIDTYPNKILNIHPSLLPKHRGLNTHQKVIDAKDKEHGATVHVVTSELDAGPILGQQRIEVNENDTAESLEKRLKTIEHRLYVDVLKSIVDGIESGIALTSKPGWIGKLLKP